MNLKIIQEILNLPIVPDEDKKQLILQEIAKDKGAIPHLLTILNEERVANNNVISELSVVANKLAVNVLDLECGENLSERSEAFLGEFVELTQKHDGVKDNFMTKEALERIKSKNND